MRRLTAAWGWLTAREQAVLTAVWVTLIVALIGLGVGLAWLSQHAPVEPLPFFK